MEPVFGVTESQVRPAGLVTAVAVNWSGVVPSVLTSEICWVAVAVEPVTATTLIAAGLAFNNGVLLTLSVTGMVIVPPDDWTVTVVRK